MTQKTKNKGRSRQLRLGRRSLVNQTYILTFATQERRRLLEQPENARIVLDALHWLDGKDRIDLLASVIMPDHVHFVATLKRGSLASLMQSLKGYTARQINRRRSQAGPVWQPQYHDHAIRSDEDLAKVVRYVLENPIRAGLVSELDEYPYWYCRWEVV